MTNSQWCTLTSKLLLSKLLVSITLGMLQRIVYVVCVFTFPYSKQIIIVSTAVHTVAQPENNQQPCVQNALSGEINC